MSFFYFRRHIPLWKRVEQYVGRTVVYAFDTKYRDCFFYSGLNLNQYSVASPCRTICTVCGFVALS
ncbi:hypothetical protein M5112_02285 [Neisseria meningitidis]|nr:hypothetical protein [Neisseria meningitidis]MCL5866033.1 hypothetical protein [Neisseria meningitidis]MCL5870764.1 hypothetical protein [Neisseria meningitidis]MCL6113776.1 hypothetical protein [Neisseria meningitidis]